MTDIKTQDEITTWEKSRMKAIKGWEIHYDLDEQYDIIIFEFYNKQKVTFKRLKP